MGALTRRMNGNAPSTQKAALTEKLYKEDRSFRADRLREKWQTIPELGKGLEKLDEKNGRNTAIFLENQARLMSRMTETQLSNSFQSFSPENMLRLVRLAFPNTIRNKLFSEYAMESAKDSIKYIRPVYTDAQNYSDTLGDKTFNSGNVGGDPYSATDPWNKDGALNYNENNYRKAMYETTEDRYVSEIANGAIIEVTSGTTYYVTYAGNETSFVASDNGKVLVFGKVSLSPGGAAISGTSSASPFAKFPMLDGYITVFADSEQHPIAMQVKTGAAEAISGGWITKPEAAIAITSTATPGVYVIAQDVTALQAAYPKTYAEYVAAKAYARYDSESDFTGEFLGEVEIVMTDYWFRPRPTSIGVTWSQLTEIILDNSFGVSSEELLVDSAGQEIKKALDFRAVRIAYQAANMNPAAYNVIFNAAAGDTSDESYLHTAQTLSQAIERVGDITFNDINRGGVSRIVGGPAAVSYAYLNSSFTTKGQQEKIGGHQVGEVYGIPLFKVPSNVIPDNKLLCIWKNDSNDADIAIVFGTLIPFFSTGMIQRKNFYVEAALASYGDYNVLQKKYLGLITITGLRQI